MAKGDMVYLVTSYGKHSGDLDNLKVFGDLDKAEDFASLVQEQAGDDCIISIENFIME